MSSWMLRSKSLVGGGGGGDRPNLLLAQVQDLTGTWPGLDLNPTWDLDWDWDLDLSLTINSNWKCKSFIMKYNMYKSIVKKVENIDISLFYVITRIRSSENLFRSHVLWVRKEMPWRLRCMININLLLICIRTIQKIKLKTTIKETLRHSLWDTA